MDDLRLLQQVGQEVPLASSDQLAPARDRLLAAMTGTPVTPAAPATIRRGARRGRRFVFGGVAAAGVAAAIVSVLVLAPDQVGGDVPAARADAGQVLRNAAAAALRLPDTTPRPDQFIYTRSQEGRDLRESWMSVNGTRDGLVRTTSADGTADAVIPGCRNGRAAVVKGGQVLPGQTEPCTPEPGYRSDLPTDAAAMGAYLAEHRSGEPGSVNSAGKDVYYFAGGYLRPQSRAALYEAAATVTGLRAVENVTDGAGRPGIGIAWPSTGGTGEMVLVFDPESYAFLGVSGASAVLALAVVDKVGQTG
ncbi:CU044_5270 family protein [Plantactinospora solaniradicis]|uniref:CU044_5270 family protein n=1 Tax=Plantactinospora solaniradicis TaxID=1723736 RepID=A0ABW1KJ41_9ACTN